MPLPRTRMNQNRRPTNNDNSSGRGSPLSRSLSQEHSEVQDCKNSPKNRPRRRGARYRAVAKLMGEKGKMTAVRQTQKKKKEGVKKQRKAVEEEST
eukprot:9849936-Ditylum_brightwellii.AAC.1